MSSPVPQPPSHRSALELRRGASAVVVDVDASHCESERLCSLGLRPGATFRVLSRAPLFRIRLEGACLALSAEWGRALRVLELPR